MQRFPWLSGFYRTSNEPVKSFLHCARRGLRDASSEDQRLLPVCCGQLLVLLLLLRTIARLDSLVGEEGGEKKNPQKDKWKLKMSSSCWQQRGRDSSAARATPDPLLTVECFSSLRSQMFSVESGLPHECVLRPQRSRKWSRQNKIKIIQNTHTQTVMEPATINTALNPHPRPACILELTVSEEFWG